MRARAPAGRVSRNKGRLTATWTRDTVIGLASRLVINQPDAVSNIAVPTFDNTLAVHMTVNTTEPKGPRREGAGSIGTAGALRFVSKFLSSLCRDYDADATRHQIAERAPTSAFLSVLDFCPCGEGSRAPRLVIRPEYGGLAVSSQWANSRGDFPAGSTPYGSGAKRSHRLDRIDIAHVDQDRGRQTRHDLREVERAKLVTSGDDNRRVGALEAYVGGSVRPVEGCDPEGTRSSALST